MIDLTKTVTVGQLIEFAGRFNEEARDYADDYDADGHEYLRGQVELIIDAAGLSTELPDRAAVKAAIIAASDRHFKRLKT